VKIRAGVATDIGQARERNEDSYLAQPPVFAVADGMGGHKGGDIASALALEVLGGEQLPADGAELVERVREANRAVFERSASDREVEGMGTTITATIAGQGALRIAHVGDSRAYLLRGATLRRLTEDHTLVQRMVKEGRLTEEEASVHPQRSVVTRAIGVDERVQVDEGALEVHDGDRVLLCTDGLTSMLSEKEIQSTLESAPRPQAAAEALVAGANRAGGLDNITVIVLDIEVGESERSSGEIAAETSPPAPEGSMEDAHEGAGGRSSRARWAIGGSLILLVAVLAIVGGKMYVDRQWYVGVSNGHVAVFQGIPATIAGVELHQVVEETTLPAAEAEQLAVWAALAAGITADSLVGARAIVDQIRQDLVEQQQPPGGNGGGGGSGTGPGGGGGGTNGTNGGNGGGP
jgi:serine/threonine protein phosphatase PrpC